MAVRSRYLFVDVVLGAGDFSTIQGAIDAAVLAGAATGTEWLVEVGLGTFSENIDVPDGVLVRCSGKWQHGTVLVGTATVHSGGGLAECRVVPPLNTGWALKAVMDANGGYPFFKNVNAHSSGNTNVTIAVLQATGTATGAYVRMEDCYLYANNSYTGATPNNAQNVVFHVLSDFVMYVEARSGMVFKTSTSATGTATDKLVRIDSVGGAGKFAYVHAVGEWESVYGGNGIAPTPVLLDSLNVTHPGALLNVAAINFHAGKALVSLAYTGTNPYVYGGRMGHVQVRDKVVSNEVVQV
jgi:hypothetical protein